MRRKRHPQKEVEAAIQTAETKGWRYKQAGHSSHAWGRLLCPLQQQEGCSLSIWSTPKDATVHAKQILRVIKLCPHVDEEDK